MRTLRPVALLLFVSMLPACFGELPAPPTKGYGAPYQGTGKPIYVHDARGNWDIQEGGRPITSEQALEATKDEEYEIRRQEAKKYNDQLYEEGQSHRTRGKIFTYTGIGIAVAGFAVMGILPSTLRDTKDTPATATEPEKKSTEPGSTSNAVLLGGLLVGLAGVGMAVYGYIGGNVNPPYHVWKTPPALDKSVWCRERAEEYNEAHNVPPVELQPGSVETLPLAPGQRKPPPPKPVASGKAALAAPPPSASAAPAPSGSNRPYPSGLGPAPSASAAPSARPPLRPVRPGGGR